MHSEREEVPPTLLERDMPRKAPPRASFSDGMRSGYSQQNRYREPISSEFNRRPDTFGVKEKPKGAAGFGIERFAVGTRVSHSTFGSGTVTASRDMGGDVLYEVRFDTGVVKKLMATFAKLRKI